MTGTHWKITRRQDGTILAKARRPEVAELERLPARAIEGKIVAPAPLSALAVEGVRSSDPTVRRLNRASSAGIKRAAEVEPLLADALRPTLDKAASEAARGFRGHATPAGDRWIAPAPDEILDVARLASRLERKLNPVAEAVVGSVLDAAAPPKGGVQAAGEQPEPGVGFDVANPYAKSVLDKIGVQIRHVAESIREDVRVIVDQAHEEGLSIPETARRIEEKLREGNPARAEQIARTELSAMVNGGSLAAARVYDSAAGGGKLRKQWLTGSGAPNPRHETYAGLDGQTRALNHAFDVGGFALDHPGDPSGPAGECVNCRCAVSFLQAPSGVGG